MRTNRLPILNTVVAISILALIPAISAAATEKVIFSFNGTLGSEPYGGLISDAAGNLYGTTIQGGVYGYGTVFVLIPKTGGGWTGKILHSFGPGGIDGAFPYSSLTLDRSGNVYGTTINGGSNNVGIVFKLTPTAHGPWKESILYSFLNNEQDGLYPGGPLIFDSSGNIYGTTGDGGPHFSGTVYKLTPNTTGPWTETILYTFNYSDGIGPIAGLLFDASGNLYGTTTAGGAYGFGTVFELTPQTNGEWNESAIFNFDGRNSTGDEPYATMIFDAAGNLYGTTVQGGYYDSGMVFKLSPQTDGTWTETIVHSFEPSNWDGGNPYGGLMMDAAGNLYGTTNLGGRYNYGTVYQLTPTAGGKWSEKILHFFNNNGKDGYNPYCTLASDKAGSLFGVTFGGGTRGQGTLFEIVP